ncbi:hypothetical protein ACTXGQ_15440 [Marinobacter sp. 1Y8]
MRQGVLILLLTSVAAMLSGCGGGESEHSADTASNTGGDSTEVRNISISAIEGEPVEVDLAQLGLEASDQIRWQNTLADDGATVELKGGARRLRVVPPQGFSGIWNLQYVLEKGGVRGEIRMEFAEIKRIDQPTKAFTQVVWVLEHGELSLAAPPIERDLEFVSNQVLARTSWEGFDLDGVSVSEVSGAIELRNPTPRVIAQPVIRINGQLFKSTEVLPAFTLQVYKAPSLSETIQSVQFVEARPFMRLNVSRYVKEAPSTSYLNVLTALETDQFNNVIANHRMIDNRWDTNREFLRWMGASVCGVMNPGWAVCGNDASTADALMERLARKIDNKYGSLRNNGAIGLAGGAWLALKTHQLTGIGANSFYYHEHMHNHGFSHGSGLTYGWSDRLDGWSKSNPDLQFERSEPAGEPAELVGEVSWKTRNGVPQARVEIHDILDRDLTVDRLIVGVRHAEIGSVGLARNVLYINFVDYPSLAGAPLIINGAHDASGSGNLAVLAQYPSHMGVRDDLADGIAFIVRGEGGQPDLFTPDEAKAYCENKGFSLAPLARFKSMEMIEFQNRHLKYGTQVGISHETGEPAAFNVQSSYQTSAVQMADRGALILCR